MSVALAALVVLDLAAIVDQGLAVVNRVTLRALLEEHASPHRVPALVDHPQSVRSAMLLLELIAAAVVLTGLSLALDPLPALVAGVLALVIAGRAVPAVVVRGNSAPERYGRLGNALGYLARPFTLFGDLLARLVGRANGEPEPLELPGSVGEEPANGSDHGAHDEDAIEEEEQEMISGVLHLDQAHVREIMVPRPDIVAVAIDTPLDEVVAIARRAGHSRIPVYRDSIDTIVGVVYAKDFLRFVGEGFAQASLSELLRPAYFVPESKRIGELLQDLRQGKVHLAVVVDEYGGTAGLVTIEDILEEIVGEIQDEYDRELPLLERVGPAEIIVDGRIAIDEVAEIFATEFEDGDVETIGGFVQQQLGRIPKAGESVRFDGLMIEVQAVEHHRIRKLRVVRVSDEAPAVEAASA
ncbi:MAG TPA: hemolysin family protein [Candidatus Limnocylindria bacterium]|nr:hemolysin family protein [Candidatus Limnocylindria bacterium]